VKFLSPSLKGRQQLNLFSPSAKTVKADGPSLLKSSKGQPKLEKALEAKHKYPSPTRKMIRVLSD